MGVYRLLACSILTSSKHWVLLERESVEELGLMLKMIKGLDKVDRVVVGS